jgi:hypothetical protein
MHLYFVTEAKAAVVRKQREEEAKIELRWNKLIFEVD